MRYAPRRKDPIAVLVNLTMVGICTLFALGGLIGVLWALGFLILHAYDGLALWLG